MPGRLPEAVVKPSRVFYLHGFASSAKSTKAGYFAERLCEHDICLDCPDFNEPDFATLTLTRMIDQLGSNLANSSVRLQPDSVGRVRLKPDATSGAVTLIGSSLGGTLAILAAEKLASKIDRVVLLAPAGMFAKPGHHPLPPGPIAAW